MSNKLERAPHAQLPRPKIEPRILEIRNQRVILDSDLAALYGVPTKQLNQQVRRNQDRFPTDFVFQLKKQELTALRSQFVTAATEVRGTTQHLPLAFTEHGAIMAANVLKSERAILVSVQVVRAFIRLREMILSHQDLAKRLDLLEKKYDGQFKVVFEAIRQLMIPPVPPKRPIGFET
jgi:hypothetical protein